MREIKGPAAFLGSQFKRELIARFGRHVAQIDQRHSPRLWFIHQLNRMTIDHRKDRAEYFVTPQYAVQTLLESATVKWAFEADGRGNVIAHISGSQLIDKSYSLLRKRHR